MRYSKLFPNAYRLVLVPSLCTLLDPDNPLSCQKPLCLNCFFIRHVDILPLQFLCYPKSRCNTPDSSQINLSHLFCHLNISCNTLISLLILYFFLEYFCLIKCDENIFPFCT